MVDENKVLAAKVKKMESEAATLRDLTMPVRPLHMKMPMFKLATSSG